MVTVSTFVPKSTGVVEKKDTILGVKYQSGINTDSSIENGASGSKVNSDSTMST